VLGKQAVGLGVVVAGPATFAPKSSRCFFTFRITAEVEIPDSGAEGVLITQGGR
jgi:hypothetical protein